MAVGNALDSNINTPRNYTNLGNTPLPYNFTNNTANDLLFNAFMQLVVSPGQSTTVNTIVNGEFVNQLNLSTPITYPDPQVQTNPWSFLVPPGGVLQITLVGQSQILGPAIAHINL